jgi:predicted Rossmann-fold nucleotide-binding protein
MADDALDQWIAAFPDGSGIPFHLKPPGLYTVATLYDTYNPDRPGSWVGTYDQKAYDWFVDASTEKPRKLSVAEAIAARLHDAVIETAIDSFLKNSATKVVGFMGGHDTSRRDPSYRQIASIARTLRRDGFQIVSGGGPGLMEAANLGAFLAPYADERLDDSLHIFGDVDFKYKQDPSPWINTACAVRKELLGDWKKPASPDSSNLGIPTWLYGNEPPNLFASVIGKYFYNSVREDGLVSVASGGLVFGSGNAGTVQEVFQDAVLNYYRKASVKPTPMVFLGTDFWHPAAYDPVHFSPHTHPKPVFPLIEKLARDASNPFPDSLLLSDDPNAILTFLRQLESSPSGAPTLAEVRLARQ